MLDQDKTKEQLIAELHNLEKLVEARTAELTALNNQLQHEIEQHKATQEALQSSESNFLSLVELSPDGIGIEQNGKVIFVNAVGVEMLGAQSPDQIIGKSLMDLVHPDYQEKVRDRIQKISNDKTQLPYIEEKLIRLDGGVIDVEAGSAACANNIPSAQVVFRDITKRKADEESLRSSEEQLRSVIETAHDAIITTDPQGNVTFLEYHRLSYLWILSRGDRRCNLSLKLFQNALLIRISIRRRKLFRLPRSLNQPEWQISQDSKRMALNFLLSFQYHSGSLLLAHVLQQ